MQHTVNIWIDRESPFIYNWLCKYMFAEMFPHTQFTNNQHAPPQLILKHHLRVCPGYDVPYISWSGEAVTCIPCTEQRPLFMLDTTHSSEKESVWCPLIVQECQTFDIVRPYPNSSKRWCCSYAFTNCVKEREELFLSMRQREPSCYAFGSSCFTRDNPFVLTQQNRLYNRKAFQPFAFNVAMENSVHPGYLTEKIGHAFASGSVPIYWGDTETVKDFFNPASFLNVGDFASPATAGEFAVQLWRDPQKVQPYLDAPITVNNRLADYKTAEMRPWKMPIYNIMKETFPDII